MADPLVAVLAAGRASRFGGGKLDAPCAGKALGQRVLDAVAAAGLAPGVVVTGREAPACIASAAGWTLLTNPAPEHGLGTSLAIAARAALDVARPLLVLLADMPLVPAAYLAALAAHPGPAATRHADGRPGVPALLPLALLPEVAALTGDAGAGPLLARAAGLVLRDPPPGALRDVDTPADLAVVEALLKRP